MFEQDGVTEHQVRSGETGDLVVREVPRHDAQDRSDWATFQDSVCAVDFEVKVAGELFTVGGEVPEDGGTEFGFFSAFGVALTHFLADDVGEFVFSLVEQGGYFSHNVRTLWHRACRPFFIRVVREGESFFNLCVGRVVEGFNNVTSFGVFYAVTVSHHISLKVDSHVRSG